MKGHKHSLNKYHQWADEVQVGKEAEQREERKWKKRHCPSFCVNRKLQDSGFILESCFQI